MFTNSFKTILNCFTVSHSIPLGHKKHKENEAQAAYEQGKFFEKSAYVGSESSTHTAYSSYPSTHQTKRNAMWNFLNAALKGHMEAQYKLGLSYLNGDLGLDRNYVLAEKWLNKAAQQGHPEAKKLMLKSYEKIAFS